MSSLDISYPYIKLRNTFGRQPQFCEQGPHYCDSIDTNPEEFFNYILRNPVHQATQHTPNFSHREINTIRAEYANVATSHTEGGWPREVAVTDPEATERYRRKVLKEDGYVACVQNMAPVVEHLILQNNAVDMYETYYSDMGPQPPIEKVSIRTVNHYRDDEQRPIGSLTWQAESAHRFAASYVDVDFYMQSQMTTTAFIWDVEYPTLPESRLEPPAPLFDLQFNPREEEILAGALATGQVTFWDRRVGPATIGICPMHVAHRDLTRKILFIYSKTGMEIFSGSPDGTLKWWDLRKLDATTDEMIIDIPEPGATEQNMAAALGVSTLEYEPTMTTRYMVGTDNGLVVAGNRKGKTIAEKLPNKYDAHSGPVISVQRNPLFLKNFLTVGDWTVKIFTEECRESPILWSAPMRHKINGGEWSPTRLTLFALASSDGSLQLWDLIRCQYEPLATMKICDQPLTALKFQEKGGLMLVGNQLGVTSLIELCQELTDSGKNDKLVFNASLERETKRERILEAKVRELKLKLRQAEEGGSQGSVEEVDNTIGDKDLAEATNEYNAGVKKELANF